MTSLSILIVVHNEEKQLESCLKPISFGNELVVILDKCTDKSKQIAKKFHPDLLAADDPRNYEYQEVFKKAVNSIKNKEWGDLFRQLFRLVCYSG